MDEHYWWLRFGNYSPGSYNLPHMGEVIADFRRRRYRTQEEFATAVRDKIRNVQEWETQVMMNDTGRRIFLARLLQIPPALLGLTWHQVYSDYSSDDYNRSLERLPQAVEEDAYYTYEDVLTLGWKCFYQGGASELAYRFNKRLTRLKTLVPLVPAPDREAWQRLLAQYYCFCGNLAGFNLKRSDQAITYYNLALSLAKQLDDHDLICHAYLLLADVYGYQGNLSAAHDAMLAAMEYIKDSQAPITPIKGNVYLKTADIKTLLAGSSQKAQSEVRSLQDKAANMLYKGSMEDDGTFLKFNLAAVNHEKAKSLLLFARQRSGEGRAIAEGDREGIQARLRAALNAIPPDLTFWKTSFHLTEAEMYLAQHNIEASASAGKEALKAATIVDSQRGVDDVKNLYTSLRAKGPGNPYVDNLGIALGLF